MMERLTKRNKDGVAFWNGANGLSYSDNQGNIYGGAIEKLAYYEDLEEQMIAKTGVGLSSLMRKYFDFLDDMVELANYRQLEEQGLLLRLPCKVGTKKIYMIDQDKDIYCLIADEVTIKRFPKGTIVFEYDSCEFAYEDFGQTVFLAREEAEAKIKELESKE